MKKSLRRNDSSMQNKQGTQKRYLCWAERKQGGQKFAVEPGGGRGVDDASDPYLSDTPCNDRVTRNTKTVPLLAHARPSGASHRVGAVHVHTHDLVPLLFIILWKEVSRRIPALLITMSTQPNASMALCTIFSPSSTESEKESLVLSIHIDAVRASL